MMALPLSPFTPDPGYEHTTAFIPKGKPDNFAPHYRVRPEARAIAQRQCEDTIARLLHGSGDFLPPGRKSVPQRNHSQANQVRIREVAERGRRKREEVDKTIPPTTSSHKYSHVPSKVDTNLECRPKTAPKPKPTRPAPKPSTDSAVSSSKNYLAANIRAASEQSLRQDPQQERLAEVQRKKDEDLSHHKRGKLPQYLVSRRLQWKKAEEERLANKPDPSIPPGHSLMSDLERQSTLDLLTQHQSSLTQELRSLPLSTDTLKHRLRRAELENKLTEIDDALKIFSRPKVFVKNDD